MKQALRIPFSELQFEYVRSRGPGGQNVNRTNSAAILRWNVPGSPSFSWEEKEKILTKLRNQISQSGDLILRSDEFRDQDQNRSQCLKKLDQLLAKAFFTPKKRYATKPTRGSKERKLKEKNRRSQIKSLRGPVKGED